MTPPPDSSKKISVLFDLANHLAQRHPLPRHLPRLGLAGLCADGAPAAGEIRDALRTGGETIAAMPATLLEIQHLGAVTLALGIVTPPAGERAALEKDRGADTGPIVRGKPHDVEDARHSSQPSHSLLLEDLNTYNQYLMSESSPVVDDPLANFLLSQIRNAFGDRSAPLTLAEKAVALDGRTAKYHRQLGEVGGVLAQHANALQEVFLARRFRKEIDAAVALDPLDIQAWRYLPEFYLLAPGIVGGDRRKAAATAEQTEALLVKAAAAEPPSYRARIELARFYRDSGQRTLNQAERLAKDAIRLDRGRVDAYAVLAQVYAD